MIPHQDVDTPEGTYEELLSIDVDACNSCMKTVRSFYRAFCTCGGHCRCGGPNSIVDVAAASRLSFFVTFDPIYLRYILFTTVSGNISIYY